MLRKAIKGRFQTGESVRQGSAIPIANTSNELVEMDFSDYVELSTFLHIRGDFSRSSAIIFYGGEKERRTNGRNGSRKGDVKLAGGVWGAWNYRCG